jgi:hypothetical protein
MVSPEVSTTRVLLIANLSFAQGLHPVIANTPYTVGFCASPDLRQRADLCLTRIQISASPWHLEEHRFTASLERFVPAKAYFLLGSLVL